MYFRTLPTPGGASALDSPSPSSSCSKNAVRKFFVQLRESVIKNALLFTKQQLPYRESGRSRFFTLTFAIVFSRALTSASNLPWPESSCLTDPTRSRNFDFTSDIFCSSCCRCCRYLVTLECNFSETFWSHSSVWPPGFGACQEGGSEMEDRVVCEMFGCKSLFAGTQKLSENEYHENQCRTQDVTTQSWRSGHLWTATLNWGRVILLKLYFTLEDLTAYCWYTVK